MGCVDRTALIGEAGVVRARTVQRRWLCLWIIFLAIALGGCASSSDSDTLVVFAASSLTDVLPPVAESFTLSTGTEVELNFAGSSALREQILDGSPAGVFVSANPGIMAELATLGLIRPSIQPVATNSIVLAVPADNPAQVTGLDSLTQDDLIIGLCAREVPCGQLSVDVLAVADIDPAVDTFEPSVRALVGKVELGEVDAALVYDTDVIASDDLTAIGEPFTDAGSTVYVAASLVGSGGDSDRFVDFLTGGLAQSALEDAGFGAP